MKRMVSKYPKGAGLNKRMKNLHEVQPEEDGPESKRTSADSLPNRSPQPKQANFCLYLLHRATTDETSIKKILLTTYLCCLCSISLILFLAQIFAAEVVPAVFIDLFAFVWFLFFGLIGDRKLNLDQMPDLLGSGKKKKRRRNIVKDSDSD